MGDNQENRRFFIKEMYKAAISVGILYSLAIYIIFDLEIAIYLTVFNFTVGLLFIKPVIDSAFKKNITKLQLTSIFNICILVTSTAFGLFYYSYPVLDIILFCIVIIFIMVATFHSNLAHTIGLTKGSIYLTTLKNNPAGYIAASLATWQFMQMFFFIGLIWLVINDFAHSTLIALLIYSISLLFNRKRSILIVNEQKKHHAFLLFLADTIVILTSISLMYFFDKEVVLDSKYYILAISLIYYSVKVDSKEDFNEKKDTEDS